MSNFRFTRSRCDPYGSELEQTLLAAGSEPVQASGVGVCTTESDLQCAVQAQAEPAGDRGFCGGLG